MKKLLLFTSIYINFTICNDISQVSTWGTNNSNQNTISISGQSNNEDDNEIALYGSVKFTPSGLKCFFNHKFNSPKYAQDFLPHKLSDVIQFLEYAKNTNQNKKFIKSTLKIFHQQFKSIEYLNGQEFTRLVNKMPELLDYAFVPQANELQIRIKDILYSEFLNKYQFFQEDPYKFFNNLSEKIYVSIHKDDKVVIDDIGSDELRSMIVRFVEGASSKLVWFIEDEPNIWIQFKQTCDSLYNLKTTNIIYDLEDINDLIHGALARFKLVLEVRGSVLSSDFYKKVYDEIIKDCPAWLDLEEQDELMVQKKDLLVLALKKAHAKSLAREKYGIVT